MEAVEKFLASASKLEEGAVLRVGQLADAMVDAGRNGISCDLVLHLLQTGLETTGLRTGTKSVCL
jgi:hypothetical protein